MHDAPDSGGGKVVGIEPFQTGLLADKLDDASKATSGISGQLSTIYDDIETSYHRIGIRLGPPPRVARDGDTGLDDEVRAPVDTIASQAPGIASDIRRRVKMLYDCINGTNPLYPGSFFLDGPLPDPQKVNDALKYFNDHIDDSGGFLWSNSAQGAGEVYDKIKDLSPSELDAFLAALSPDQLKELNDQLGEGSSWWGGGDPDHGVQKEFATLLSSKLPIDIVDNYRAYLTNLPFPEPALMKDQKGQWVPVTGTLFGPNGVDIKHDLQQGGDGDCWFLSSLAAIAERDPNFFQSHIKQNPDGTYTATFYDDNGNPVPITVDNTLPVDQGGTPLYAKTPDNVLWVAIYEKAYTVFRSQNNSGHPYDTYDDINGGWGGTGLHDLTGADSVSTQTKDSSLAAVAAEIQKGHAVVTGTLPAPPNAEFLDPYSQIVGSHAYSVESVDLHANPPTITLLNPWGEPSGIQEITLTEAQWKQYFGEYATNPVQHLPSFWKF